MTTRRIISWCDKVPLQFGHPMLEYFPFDPGYTNLNHRQSLQAVQTFQVSDTRTLLLGSYGSLPLPVMEACRVLDSEAESSPDYWMKFTYPPRLINVHQQIAALIGAETDECVLVPNASQSISTVLRNIEWQEDDIIVAFKTRYNSVERMAQYISDTPPQPAVSTVALTFPTLSVKVLAQFRDHLRRLPRKDGQKIVAIIDSIASLPALLLPWKEMSVLSIIDAAHSIGQEINLGLNKADPDFWTSNCHKWLYAKRSCAVLYSTFPTSQEYISPSKRNGPNFVEQFEWTATIDFVPYFSVLTALDFRQWLGAQILGTSASALDPSGEMMLNMTNVQLPPPPSLSPVSIVSGKLKKKLLLNRNLFATVFFLEGMGWWTRFSAQLGKTLVEVCSEIVKETQVDEAKLKSKL
ncbi:PLP-dependent transferase [Mycena olivaceomarginata]|nr:PLP-dependent transferase [Mycena olivaceomarginata]